MSTIIYPSPIFGPVHSRRLGVSLGINLLPGDGKQCSFDCIYCECGFNKDHVTHSPRPTRAEVAAALERQLQKMVAEGVLPDVMTFAGNGEPTLHKDFAGIIDDTIALRNRYCPKAKIAVLSNAAQCMRPAVHDALMKVDDNILKLDTVDAEYIRLTDRPVGKYDVEEIVRAMAAFDGHVIVQTMFMKGTHNGISVDNTSDEFVLPWLDALKNIRPQQVMIYTIDRETPDANLRKATHEDLDRIADILRQAVFNTSVSY